MFVKVRFCYVSIPLNAIWMFSRCNMVLSQEIKSVAVCAEMCRFDVSCDSFSSYWIWFWSASFYIIFQQDCLSATISSFTSVRRNAVSQVFWLWNYLQFHIFCDFSDLVWCTCSINFVLVNVLHSSEYDFFVTYNPLILYVTIVMVFLLWTVVS